MRRHLSRHYKEHHNAKLTGSTALQYKRMGEDGIWREEVILHEDKKQQKKVKGESEKKKKRLKKKYDDYFNNWATPKTVSPTPSKRPKVPLSLCFIVICGSFNYFWFFM